MVLKVHTFDNTSEFDWKLHFHIFFRAITQKKYFPATLIFHNNKGTYYLF